MGRFWQIQGALYSDDMSSLSCFAFWCLMFSFAALFYLFIPQVCFFYWCGNWNILWATLSCFSNCQKQNHCFCCFLPLISFSMTSQYLSGTYLYCTSILQISITPYFIYKRKPFGQKFFSSFLNMCNSLNKISLNLLITVWMIYHLLKPFSYRSQLNAIRVLTWRQFLPPLFLA